MTLIILIKLYHQNRYFIFVYTYKVFFSYSFLDLCFNLQQRNTLNLWIKVGLTKRMYQQYAKCGNHTSKVGSTTKIKLI